MEQTLFTVTDDKGTVLKPIDATYSINYMYKEDPSSTTVLEGVISRGAVKGEEFPEKDPLKELEYSEIIITTESKPGGWNAYSGKAQRFLSKTPEKGEGIKLPFTGTIPTKEEAQESMEARKKEMIAALEVIYPPSN